MEDLILNLVLVLAAALVGGMVAQRLGLPPILGYLLAGVALSPHTIGPVGDIDQVQVAADLGVALLMFTLGVRFSFRELAELRQVAVLGGAGQILLTMALGLPLAIPLGLGVQGGLYLGAIIAMSSTMLALKLLESRGEAGSLQGRIAVSLSLVQDLSVVPLVIILPTFGNETQGIWSDLGLAVAKAAGLLLATYFLGTRIIPWLLFRIAALPVRELFRLAIFLLALGMSLGSLQAGLSLAFGAFLAGLVVSESEFSYQALAEVLPLRDIFATAFFVAMGMLIDPRVFLEEPWLIIAIAAAAVVGKFLIISGIIVAFRYPLVIGLGTGLALAQMGEFSFVLANIGVNEGIINEQVRSTILAAALLTIILIPLLLGVQDSLFKGVAALPVLGKRLAGPVPAFVGGEHNPISNHVVIAGFGRTGQELARVLDQRGFRYLVVDNDPYVIREVRQRNIPCVYGDISYEAVLQQCNLDRARVLALTVPDLTAAQVAVSITKRINPDLDIVARGTDMTSQEALLQAGVVEVVRPEFESGMEFVRHTLHRFGIPSVQIQAIISRQRLENHGE